MFSAWFLRRAVVEGARVESQHFSEQGYFNISVELEAYDIEFDSETMFECVLTIPDTDYKLQEKIVYFPGKYKVITNNIFNSGTVESPWWLTGLFSSSSVLGWNLLLLVSRVFSDLLRTRQKTEETKGDP